MTHTTKSAFRRRGVSVRVHVAPLHVFRAVASGYDGIYVISVASRLDRRQRGRLVRRLFRGIERVEATGDWRELPSAVR
jgi:hypothetical protein